jgi:polysaccharide biosynthesis protein PslL
MVTSAPSPLRFEWIDIAKGVGILGVVAGHIWGGPVHDALFVFHMPLFFFLSGFLFYPRSDRFEFLTQKTVRLLIPYFFFLLFIFIPRFYHASLTIASNPDYFRDTLMTMLAGGSELKGTAGVFWFVTCLFCTQQIVNLLLTSPLRRAAAPCVAILLVFGYGNQILFPHWQLPWAANVVFMAAPIFYTGFLLRGHIPGRWTTIAASAVMLTAFIFVMLGTPLAMDMKRAHYGIPLASLMAALACILVILQAGRWLAKFVFFRRSLGMIGRASMTILFLHLPVIVLLQDYLHLESPWALCIAGIALPLAGHWIFSQFSVTRAFLLGSHNDFARIFRRRIPSVSELPLS